MFFFLSGHLYCTGDSELVGHLQAVHRRSHRLYRRGDPAKRDGHLLLDTLYLQCVGQGKKKGPDLWPIHLLFDRDLTENGKYDLHIILLHKDSKVMYDK